MLNKLHFALLGSLKWILVSDVFALVQDMLPVNTTGKINYVAGFIHCRVQHHKANNEPLGRSIDALC